MKTLRNLKITGIIQTIYCAYSLISTLLMIIASNTGNLALLNKMAFLFYYTVEFSMFILPVCFVVNLESFIKERKHPEQRNIIGKKWIWIFIWPVITSICFFIHGFPFIRVHIF